jgi:hypothetical protein
MYSALRVARHHRRRSILRQELSSTIDTDQRLTNEACMTAESRGSSYANMGNRGLDYHHTCPTRYSRRNNLSVSGSYGSRSRLSMFEIIDEAIKISQDFETTLSTTTSGDEFDEADQESSDE